MIKITIYSVVFSFLFFISCENYVFEPGDKCTSTIECEHLCIEGLCVNPVGNEPINISQNSILKGKKFVSVESGPSFSCASNNDGETYCWGVNISGRLGNGTDDPGKRPFKPVKVDFNDEIKGEKITSLGVGSYHACGLSEKGNAYCWGNNESGELGDPLLFYSFVPIPVYDEGVLNEKELKLLTAGYSHTCAVDKGSNMYCWGDNYNGQLGDGSEFGRTMPVEVDTTGVLSGKEIVSISAGSKHTCSIDTDGKAYCWGINLGILGDGSNDSGSTIPVAVDDTGVLKGKKLIYINSGYEHTCAIDNDGQSYCWGYRNNKGQLGDGSEKRSLSPVRVKMDGALKGHKLVSISAGSYHTCALDSEGAAYCWGDNSSGQLGDGSEKSSLSPVKVKMGGALKGRKLVSISAGRDFTCTVDTKGEVFCWGYDFDLKSWE
jgi:alpha-tubulin suppressor-like RCC1 family protein